MSWINKILPAGISRTDGDRRTSVPEGVWTKCIKCESVLYRPDLERNANVCPKCGHHMRLGARARLDLFLDKDGREEVFSDIEPVDRLRFRDKKKYTARLAAAQKTTGERDALVAIRGTLHDMPVVAVAFEFGFHGGSMGQAVGEKFSRAAQLALAERIPLICFAASGGARMQEALISLMQMAKTSAVIERMHTESVPYVSVMTDPIYGGVSASLALLGDLNIAEPDARAGFAGPNIIEQTIRQKLPKGFQRSEFLLEHGAIDMIVHRLEMRDTLARILAKLSGEAALAAAVVGDGADGGEIAGDDGDDEAMIAGEADESSDAAGADAESEAEAVSEEAEATEEESEVTDDAAAQAPDAGAVDAAEAAESLDEIQPFEDAGHEGADNAADSVAGNPDDKVNDEGDDEIGDEEPKKSDG